MAWDSNQPIRFQLGSIAIWNRFTKGTVNLRDGVLTQLQKWAPEQFEELMTAPRPKAMGDHV